ncbi:MAG TPA: ArdC-like ssDNA-binding domain-containing protein [Xanthobacteraceae bacterium]
MAKIDLYQEVTNAIVAELEAGTVPWKQPWSRSPGRNVVANAVTKRAYSGINVLALWIAMAKHGYAVPRFLTFKQALDAGGNVRKGEHGHRVYFVKDLKFEDGENADGEERTRSVRMLKRFVVFNVAQCEGLPERLLTIPPPKARNPDGRDEWADAFVAATGARIIEGAGDVASYNPRTDTINVPAFGSFKSRDTYYAASFHELTHWTEAKSRTDRATALAKRFGTGDRPAVHVRAAEELVAELGASFLCAEFAFDNDNAAGYIANYLELLKSDAKAIFTCASQAQKAVDYLRGLALAESAEVEIADTVAPAPLSDHMHSIGGGV